MTKVLDLADIQGNVLSAYGRQGFPKGRILLLHIHDALKGRQLLNLMRPKVTTALRWPSSREVYPEGTVMQARPEVTLNLAFTFWGLAALQVPIRTLRGMPDEFAEGMAARCAVLGDMGPSAPSRWDPVWQPGASAVHVMVTLNAQMQADGSPVEALAEMTRWIAGLCAASDGGVSLLSGHRGADPDFQEMSAIMMGGAPTPFEHFGFRDAIGDPVFEGQAPPEVLARDVIGQGKLLGNQTWAPIATGEFLLGHPDEAQELAGEAMPLDFSRNGTFFAYRKLHQNVAAWRDWVAATAVDFGAVMGLEPEAASATLKAKMVGRWEDGVPLIQAPDFDTWQDVRRRREAAQAEGDTATLAALERALVDFTFANDPAGTKCPFGSHLRRGNTRDMLDPRFGGPLNERLGSALNNRRRILRRGLPYGESPAGSTDAEEHGVAMMAVCASLFRQFEFVQQQWMEYGLDFNAGNDTCPVIGSHGPDTKFVIAVEPGSGRAPFVCTGMPQFVETHGGGYFFVPSMTSLRMITTGVVDPT